MKYGRKERIILSGSLVFFALVYTVQVVLNHYYLRTYALDYGYYNQAFWDFAHFRVNANTVMEPPLHNYFQIHPGFTLLLLSPLYWIFNPIFGTYSLLIIQNIFIILGGYSVYLLIRQKTKSFWIAILAFLHFNLIWGHYSALSADFIETTIGASMVPVFLLYFDKRKFYIAGILFLFIISCKENMPIWFIFIAVTLLLTYKDRQSRWIAAGFGLFSLLYLVFLFQFLIPHFEEPGRPYWGFAYSALGNNPTEALLFIAKHPVETLRLLFVNHLGDPAFNNIKAEFYIVFLISGGILLFCRPVYIIPFIPVIAQKMFNDSFVRWGILGFYSIEAVSILTVAVFLATMNIKNTRLKYGLYVLLCLSTLTITLFKMDHRVSLWYDTPKENFMSHSFYTSEFPVKRIRRQIMQFVPNDSPMAASQNLVPHYAYRDQITIFPYVHDAEYIIILKQKNFYPVSEQAFKIELSKYLQNPEWNTILDDYPLLILKKRTE